MSDFENPALMQQIVKRSLSGICPRLSNRTLPGSNPKSTCHHSYFERISDLTQLLQSRRKIVIKLVSLA